MTIFGFTLTFDKDFVHKVAAQAVFAGVLAALGVIQIALAAHPEYAIFAAFVGTVIAAVSKNAPAS